METHASQPAQEDVEKIASEDEIVRPENRSAILARKSNEVHGQLNSDAALMPGVERPETAEALALTGNEGLISSKPHTCCFCQKIVRSRAALRLHLNIVHLKTKKWSCVHCPKFFFAQFEIENHMKWNMGEHAKKHCVQNYEECFESRQDSRKNMEINDDDLLEGVK